MTTMIPTLLFISVVATGFAPQSAAQQARRVKEPITSAPSGARVPLDVSPRGLGDVLALGDVARGNKVNYLTRTRTKNGFARHAVQLMNMVGLTSASMLSDKNWS